MGLSGISPLSLLLILVIVLLIFGAKRIQGLGKDLGSAVRGFRQGLEGESDTDDVKPQNKLESVSDNKQEK